MQQETPRPYHREHLRHFVGHELPPAQIVKGWEPLRAFYHIRETIAGIRRACEELRGRDAHQFNELLAALKHERELLHEITTKH